MFEIIEKMGLPQDTLAGKVVVITGAGRGIGKELARALAWLGAKVIIAEINDDGAEVEALIRSEGGEALYVQTDVSDEGSIKRLAEKASKEFGKVDILINNATIVETGSILEMSLEDWEKSWNVDVLAAVHLIKTFLPGMLERGYGVIVTVTSDEGMPYVAPYSASKAALSSLGLSLAAELGEESGVSVFVFAPGMVDAPGIRNAARKLAPLYGMTYEEFINQNVNPGYDGPMPAEDCAAGFAYCIAHAKDYHGQIADPFQPLARAGLLSFSSTEEKSEEKAEPEKVIPKKPIELAKEVKKILEDVEKETNELNMFAKMWVKRAFQQRTGMSIKDWLEAVNMLISELEELDRAIKSGNNGKAESIYAKLSWICSNLERLVDYFKQNKKDVEGFIKDSEKLSKAIDVLSHREKITSLLVLSLKKYGEMT